MRGATVASVVALLVGALCPSCGYSTRRLTAFPGARTVAVEPFENRTYLRDLGVRLTHAVVNEVRARTSYAIGAPHSADLVVRGHFTAEQSVEGLDPDRNPIIQRLTGTLNVQVVRRSTGEVLRREVFTAVSEFLPSDRGESLEGRGTQEWIRRMALQVVQLFETPM